MGSHSDSHKGHGDESKEMESNFCHSVSRIAKLGRNEFEECDVDEYASSKGLKNGRGDGSPSSGCLLNNQAKENAKRDGEWEDEDIFDTLFKGQLLSGHGNTNWEGNESFMKDDREKQVENFHWICLQAKCHAFKQRMDADGHVEQS